MKKKSSLQSKKRMNSKAAKAPQSPMKGKEEEHSKLHITDREVAKVEDFSLQSEIALNFKPNAKLG